MDPNFVYPALFKNEITGWGEFGPFPNRFPPSGTLGLFASGSKFYIFTTGGQVSGLIDASQTGAFGGSAANTGSLTGVFYPLNSNPNGYITGSVVRPSETGDFITSSETGVFVTGDVVRPSETGAFLTTGAADGRYALQSATGDFITTAQTGAFYPISNPSGFITGVDLSSYATQSFVTGISGDLQTKLNTVSGYAVTGYDDSITGISVTGNSTKTITLFQRDGGNLSASFTDASGALLENVVYTTGNQRISGIKTFANSGVFESDVSFSGKLIFDTSHTGEVLDGEVSWDSEYGTLQIGMNNGDVINPVGFRSFYRVKANQNIGKGKVVMAVGAVGNSEFLLAQEAANIGSSGELIMGVSAEAITAGNFGDITAFGAVKGVDTSSFASGAILYFDTSSTGGFTQVAPEAPNAKVVTALNVNPSANGTVFVRVSAGSVLGGTDSNVKFTALQDNNFIAYSSASGIWYNKTLTTGDVSGISNYVLKSETGNLITTSQTGQFVGDSETGAFLTTGAADGRYALQSETGVFVTTGQTGQFVTGAVVRPTETGAFLTTGAADARYYGLANGQSISGYAITGYNDAVTGMSVTGDTTKTITLFQRDGTTVTANFADNAGSGSSDTGYLTGYVSKSETGNIAVGAISLSLNGGGSTITTGYKSFTTVTFSGEILEYTILADRTGSIVIDVWKDSYGNFPLTTDDSICASSKPTLATGIKNTDSTLTSWTKTFSAGDIFGFNVDSVSGVTNVNLTLKVKKA